MRARTVFVVAVMFFGLSAVAFGQATYAVGSTPITTVIATGNAEPAGAITFTQVTGTTAQGTISILYSSFITSAFSAIVINCAGGYVGNCPVVATTASVYSPGLLVINIPAGVTAGSFTITGVRVLINTTGLVNLDAIISSVNNLIVAGQTVVRVISSTNGAGIAPGSVASYNTTVPIDFSTTSPGNVVVNPANGTIVGLPTTVIKARAGFLGAWSRNVGVRITVNATPPKGVTFTFPYTIASYDSNNSIANNNWVRGTSTSTTPQISNFVISSNSTSSSALQVYYYVAVDMPPTMLETLEIPVNVAVDPMNATFPLPSTTFACSVSLAPVQGPYQTSGANAGTPIGLLAPRFAALEVGPATLMEIKSTNAPPGKSMLVSPSGTSYSMPTFTWKAVADATWYQLLVNDTSASPKIRRWYTAEEAGCSSWTNTCSVMPSFPSIQLAPGPAYWWVLTWNNFGYGRWSDPMSFTVLPTPPAASGILPSGASGNRPNFIWREVSSASWYYLWVNDSSGTPVIQQWYTAAQAKCGGGDCSVPASITLPDGSYGWWVQTWSDAGYGPWSAGMAFGVSGCKPGTTVLIQASTSSSNPPPWYWWYDEGNATWHYLWVNGPSGTPLIQQWYTSAQANCDGKWCWVANPTTLPVGNNTWWIQTWSACGYGPWSDGMSLPVTLPPAPQSIMPKAGER